MSAEKDFRDLRQQLMALYEQGHHAEALALLEEADDAFADRRSHLVFWRLCLLSLCDRPGDVMALFREGLDSGLWWSAAQFDDTDLDAVRNLHEFRLLVDLSDERCRLAQGQIQPDRAVLVPDSSPPWPLLIALHGRSGNKATQIDEWQAARDRGWLVVSPQSTQAIFNGAYCWDDPATGVKDILFHRNEIMRDYDIDPTTALIGGFSQGGGMAAYAALSGSIPVRGFIGVATFWRDPGELGEQAQGSKDTRGYFVIGGRDNTLERTRQIQAGLRRHRIPFSEDLHPDLDHEFPDDFGTSFESALEFILGTPSQRGT